MIKEKIRKDLTAAMKEKQELKVSTLRLACGAIEWMIPATNSP